MICYCNLLLLAFNMLYIISLFFSFWVSFIPCLIFNLSFNATTHKKPHAITFNFIQCECVMKSNQNTYKKYYVGVNNILPLYIDGTWWLLVTSLFFSSLCLHFCWFFFTMWGFFAVCYKKMVKNCHWVKRRLLKRLFLAQSASICPTVFN